MREALSNRLCSLTGWVLFQWHSGFFLFFIRPQEREGLIERGGWEYVCVTQKGIGDRSDRSDSCQHVSGALQTHQPCLLMGCKDCFHISAIAKVHTSISESAVTLVEKLYLWINDSKPCMAFPPTVQKWICNSLQRWAHWRFCSYLSWMYRTH